MKLQNFKYLLILLLLWCVGFSYLALMTSDMTAFIVKLCILSGFMIFAVWVSKIIPQTKDREVVRNY